MYGWRAKIALIIPENNVVMEHEFNKLAPEGVSIHSTRAYSNLKGIEKHREREEQLDDIAKKLIALKPTIVVYAIDSGSFYKGAGHDLNMAKKISDVVQVPAITTATSAVNAFKKLGISKISVVTPFEDEINIRLKQFMEGYGIQVLNTDRIRSYGSYGIPDINLGNVYQFVKEVTYQDAEGIYIGCTNLRTIQIIEYLEKDLAKTVISASQATIWNALKTADINDPISGYGKLLTFQ